MALHLNWDGNQNNGIIFNDTYTNGALFTGIENKPTLSFTFDSFMYTEVFQNQVNYVEENGVKRNMSTSEENEVKSLASTWIQPLGQEGNPTLDQFIITHKAEIKQDMQNELDLGYIMTSGTTSGTKFFATLDDINSLKSGYDLAIAAGKSTLNVRDFNNNTLIDVPLSDINDILIELGTNYQNKLAKKWSLYDSINSAVDIDTVKTYIW